jgi:hypothetical protein
MYARVTLMQAPTAPPKAMTMRGTSLPWMFCARYRALQRLIIISSRPRCCVCRTCLSCLWRRCRRSLEPKMGANCTHSSIRRQAPAFVRQCWLEQPHTRHAGTVVALKAHVEISGRAWLQHRELETHGCCAGSNPREGLSDRNVHATRKNTEGVVVLPAPTQKSAQSAGRWRASSACQKQPAEPIINPLHPPKLTRRHEFGTRSLPAFRIARTAKACRWSFRMHAVALP